MKFLIQEAYVIVDVAPTRRNQTESGEMAAGAGFKRVCGDLCHMLSNFSPRTVRQWNILPEDTVNCQAKGLFFFKKKGCFSLGNIDC